MAAKLLRSDLQALARMRLKEAKKLLDSGHFGGAYYITGLAVECAIKASIAKQTKRYQFPDKDHARECFEHDPERLIKAAGLHPLLASKCQSDARFDANWTVVKDWNVSSRYDPSIKEYQARAIYSAVASSRYGVMRWLRQLW
jgi:hypothetical protein